MVESGSSRPMASRGMLPKNHARLTERFNPLHPRRRGSPRSTSRPGDARRWRRSFARGRIGSPRSPRCRSMRSRAVSSTICVLGQIRARWIAPGIALAGFRSDVRVRAHALVDVFRQALRGLHAQSVTEEALGIFAARLQFRRCARVACLPTVTIWNTATSRSPDSSGRK